MLRHLYFHLSIYITTYSHHLVHFGIASCTAAADPYTYIVLPGSTFLYLIFSGHCQPHTACAAFCTPFYGTTCWRWTANAMFFQFSCLLTFIFYAYIPAPTYGVPAAICASPRAPPTFWAFHPRTHPNAS